MEDHIEDLGFTVIQPSPTVVEETRQYMARRMAAYLLKQNSDLNDPSAIRRALQSDGESEKAINFAMDTAIALARAQAA